MKRLLFLVLINCSFALFAQEEAFVYYNNLYNEGDNYQIADIKGQGISWEWFGRSLQFSNSLGTPNSNQEYPECEEWIVLGPFDLSVAQNPVLKAILNIEYGENAVSLHASDDFPGVITPGMVIMPGTWTQVLASGSVVATVGIDTEITGDISAFAGKKNVYVGIKYVSPTTADVYTNVIKELKVIREVNPGVEEILPSVTFSRSYEGIDFFNLSANPVSLSKWSIRTGYAKATVDDDIWLIMKPFDLINAADAFFSFESKILNSTTGPVGLQIKIYRGEYTAGQAINDLVWEDYSVSRVDYRVNPTDYFFSGKLDLSDYIGGKVSLAFRYVNSIGEQYEIKNFKMFHLPDVEAPVINTLTIEKLVHNKIKFNINATEEARLYYGIFDASASLPTFDDLKNSVGTLLAGSFDYLERASDTIYSVDGLTSETAYKLMLGMEDGSGNQSIISELSFTTPVADFDAPTFNVDFTNVENHSLHAEFSPSEACTYYYIFQESALGSLTKEQLLIDGVKVNHDSVSEAVDFYSLEKNTTYSMFVYGIDLADNESGVNEFKITTLNLDLTAPEFNSYNVENITNTGFDIKVNISEVATLAYAVQIEHELPPSVTGITSGDRAIIHGELEYLSAGQDQVFQLNELQKGNEYIVYFFAKDAVENKSDIKYFPFATIQEGIPVIAQQDKERIYIDIESTFDLSTIALDYSGVKSIDGYSVYVLPGDHYSVDGTTIIAADDYSGRLIVPIYIQNGDVKSNTINIELVVSKERMITHFEDMIETMAGTNLVAVDDKVAAIALLEMQADGSFFDKLSPNSPDYSDYMTKVLSGRLKNIAKDYYLEKYRRRKRVEVRHKMYNALEFWMDNKPEWALKESSFEWPEAMGAIVLVLYKDMQEEYLEDETMRETIKRFQSKVLAFNRWCWNVPEGATDVFQAYQGNNLSSRLWGTMAMAAFTNSVPDAFVVYDALLKDMTYKYNDGLVAPAGWKTDGSFHMNNLSGGQWNWYEYGVSWLADVLEYSKLAKRTPWRIPSEKFQLMGDVMTNGAQWLNWMDFIPYNITGKYATRRGRRSNKSQLLSLFNEVRYEAFVNNYLLKNNDELLDAYGNLDQEFSSIDSSKYFWNSNIMLHGGGLYNISLVMPSVRTGNPEAGVDSIYGITNYHMGDGTCLIFNSDYSYQQRIYWNYKRLPGTTIEQDNMPLPLNIGGNNGKSLNEFAGGVSNGRSGIASFYADRDGTGNVNGYKSYFFFDEGVVALGTGIKKKLSNKVYEVLTSIDQDLLETDVTYHTTGDVINTISASTLDYNRDFSLIEPAWIHCNSNGYIVYPQNGGEQLEIGVKEQAGSWDEINGTWRLEEDNPNYIMRYDSAAVLQIGINHLKEPDNAKYAYMALPNLSENTFKALVEDNPIQIVSNSDTVQVVWHKEDKIVGIVFFKADTAFINDELSIVVDKPAIMLVKENSNGEFEAWIADPYQKELMIDIKFLIRRSNQMPLDIQRLVVLPDDVFKGKAVYTTTGDIWSQIPAIPLDENVQVETSEDKEELSEATENVEGENMNFGVFPTKLKRSDFFMVMYQLEKSGTTRIEIINLSGQTMYDKNMYVGKGLNRMQIPCTYLDQGVFIVKVTFGDKVETQKIIIR